MTLTQVLLCSGACRAAKSARRQLYQVSAMRFLNFRVESKLLSNVKRAFFQTATVHRMLQLKPVPNKEGTCFGLLVNATKDISIARCCCVRHV